MIQDMDQWLGAYAELAKERFPKADPKYPGTGAAGGMGLRFLHLPMQFWNPESTSYWMTRGGVF